MGHWRRRRESRGAGRRRPLAQKPGSLGLAVVGVLAGAMLRVSRRRRRIAAMLGYDTWADYITEVKMVKSGKNAKDVSAPHFDCHLSY